MKRAAQIVSLAIFTLFIPSFRPALASAFLGPPPTLTPGADQWQVPVIGYNLPGDILGGPKNIGQLYRRNTPVLFYACDDSFLSFFGSSGVAAIDAAFAVFNNLTNVDTYSPNLAEFPTESLQRNYSAEALTLLDLKSETMWIILEQLGFAEPERNTWDIIDRFDPFSNLPCPYGEVYILTQRNFDPTLGVPPSQALQTAYVNGTLYTYEITENCGVGGLPYDALTDVFPVDPLAHQFTSVIGAFGEYPYNTVNPYGAFFTDLTREDVGTLRFMLSSNTVNYESTGTNTIVQIPGTTPQLLFTSNLTLFAQQAFTNSPTALEALYPGLVITGSVSNWVNLYTTNITITFTNEPWAPAGYPATVLVYHTNVVGPIIVPWYNHTFGNLEAVVFGTNGWEALPLTDLTLWSNYNAVVYQNQTVEYVSPSYSVPGEYELVTNTTEHVQAVDEVSGQFFILPTNLCGVSSMQLQATFVSSLTNLVGLSTTNNTSTNISGTNLSSVIPVSVSNIEIMTFTNYAFVVQTINCVVDNVGLYQGIERIRFFRENYDSLLGRFFNPITNQYTLNEVTNGSIVTEQVQRVITQPDFVFATADLTEGPGGDKPYEYIFSRSVNWDVSTANPNQAGPGTIDPPGPANVITFNNIGLQYENLGLLNTNAYLGQASQIPLFVWGSFDGTTNPPVVYPNSASLANLANQALIQVSPTYLPVGQVGTSYSAQLQLQAQLPTNSWAPPVSWSIPSSSPGGLPPGVTMSSAGAFSGNPTQAGQFNFVVQATDSAGRYVDESYYITINPTN